MVTKGANETQNKAQKYCSIIPQKEKTGRKKINPVISEENKKGIWNNVI